MLPDVPTQVVPDIPSIPLGSVQKALHAVGSAVADALGQLPAVLSLHTGEESLQIGQGAVSRLTPLEVGADALVEGPKFSTPGFRRPALEVSCLSLLL